MKLLPPLLKRSAFSDSHAVSFTRLLSMATLFVLMPTQGREAQAQTITIYNDTGQAFSLNPFISTTCTPPGSQQTACITVTAGNSNTYNPPSGYAWYGFKIHCGTDCINFPLAGSTSCAGGRPFDCGGTTYYTGVDGNEVRISE
ncbi:MAG: hypothetical protein QY325_09740 [Flavobacteriales bacterium]|nr:MAG: hypothetical protein QY325_09740 [Flavobacteriales bacterium]